MSQGVDFHCHLDLYPDHEAVIAEAENAGIFTLTVTTTPKAWPRNRELTEATRFVRAGLGLHPQLVEERKEELQLWKNYLPEARYIAEVGLDAGPRFYRSFELQKNIFTEILICCAEVGGKVLSVHSVRAAKAVLDLIEKHLPLDRGRVVLHWFTGSKADARRAVAMGCYFSINSQMAMNERGQNLIAELPLERVLTETDGPFTNVNGRPARPTDVVNTVDAIALIRKSTPASINTAIQLNLKELLAPRNGSTGA